MAKELDRLISLLHKYVDIFAWTCMDMPGLNTNIVVHRIPLVKGSKTIKQKTRQMCPDILLKVKAVI
jgi:hypothetical protein